MGLVLNLNYLELFTNLNGNSCAPQDKIFYQCVALSALQVTNFQVP